VNPIRVVHGRGVGVGGTVPRGLGDGTGWDGVAAADGNAEALGDAVDGAALGNAEGVAWPDVELIEGVTLAAAGVLETVDGRGLGNIGRGDGTAARTC
jgi:hypothetical protein